MHETSPSRPARLAAGLLALVLSLDLAPAARAQDAGMPNFDAANNEGGGSSSGGRPLDGYLATGMLAGAALFIIGKTARR